MPVSKSSGASRAAKPNNGAPKSLAVRERAAKVELAAYDKAVALDASLSHPIALPVHLQRAYYTTMSRMLRNPSLAMGRDRNLQRQMRNDPDIEAPFQALKDGVCSNPWQVCPPRESDDYEIADEVTDALVDLPQFNDLRMHLLEACWYGPSMVNVIYDRRDGMIVPVEWLPIHPDTIAFNFEGRVGLRVGSRWIVDNPNRAMSTAIGYDSRVMLLDPVERMACVLHVFQRRGPDFEVPEESAYAYAGRGIRDVAWFYWLMKQTVLQNWCGYAERYGMGLRIGYYPTGHKNGLAQMEAALRNLAGDVSVALPRANPLQKDYEIEIKEPAASRATTFADLTDWLSANIKELLVGQNATSEGVSGGMGGSGVAQAHERTFNRRMSCVSESLDETITRQLVTPIIAMNRGPQKRPHRFETNVPKPESASLLEGVRSLIDMGAEVAEDPVRAIAGMRKPRDGERVLSLATVAASFGPAGGGPVGGVQARSGRNGAATPQQGADTPDRADEFARQAIAEYFAKETRRIKREKKN